MNKGIIILIVCSEVLFAQETNVNNFNGNNEIKINTLYLVASDFEGTYERILNDRSAIGLTLYLPLDDTSDVLLFQDIDYYISPFYRIYFGNKYASGFFMEGLAILNSGKEEPLFGPKYDTKTDFALGGGIGVKWVFKYGLLLEINIGAGKNLINVSKSGLDGILRAGISFGYRL